MDYNQFDIMIKFWSTNNNLDFNESGKNIIYNIKYFIMYFILNVISDFDNLIDIYHNHYNAKNIYLYIFLEGISSLNKLNQQKNSRRMILL
jgi:hypothetical protein